MPRQLGIPAALRRYGLTVETVPGWETRGSSTFNPRGVVCHWTAGPRTGDRPSLRVCVNGRPDLPGPLCQVFLTRAGVAVVVSANRANHAGTGGWRGLTGNAAVFGIEAESSGPGDFTEAQRSAYPRVVAALADVAGCSAAMVCGHSEWAPRRKTDIYDYTMDVMRAQVEGLRLGGGPAALTDDAMRALQRLVGVTADAVWGPQTARAVQRWLGVSADGVFGPDSTRALQRRVGVNADGIWGPATTEALTRFLIPATPVAPTPAPVPEEDIMATINDLRAVVREELPAIVRAELASYAAGPVDVSAGTDRAWQSSRDAALAAAAELAKTTIDGVVTRTDDAVASLHVKLDALVEAMQAVVDAEPVEVAEATR